MTSERASAGRGARELVLAAMLAAARLLGWLVVDLPVSEEASQSALGLLRSYPWLLVLALAWAFVAAGRARAERGSGMSVREWDIVAEIVRCGSLLVLGLGFLLGLEVGLDFLRGRPLADPAAAPSWWITYFVGPSLLYALASGFFLFVRRPRTALAAVMTTSVGLWVGTELWRPVEALAEILLGPLAWGDTGLLTALLLGFVHRAVGLPILGAETAWLTAQGIWAGLGLALVAVGTWRHGRRTGPVG